MTRDLGCGNLTVSHGTSEVLGRSSGNVCWGGTYSCDSIPTALLLSFNQPWVEHSENTHMHIHVNPHTRTQTCMHTHTPTHAHTRGPILNTDGFFCCCPEQRSVVTVFLTL